MGPQRSTSYYFILPWLTLTALVTLCHPAMNRGSTSIPGVSSYCFELHPRIPRHAANRGGSSHNVPSFKINMSSQFHALGKLSKSKCGYILTLSKLMILSQSFISLSIAAQSGDIHPNPGPRTKYPCGVCSRACKWNQNCIVCDNCETWLHKQCIGMSSTVFNQLANSSCTWICNSCGLPQFSSSLFESSISTSNSFETLADCSGSESELSSPLMASSPISSNSNRSRTPPCPPRSPGPHRRRKEQNHTVKDVHGIRLLILNLQGIMSKTQSFANKLKEFNPHIVLATETWLTPDVGDSEFLPPSCNYTAYRKDRQSKGGGVLILVRNDMVASCVPELDTDTELLWVKLQIVNTKPVYIGVFYRQPKLGAEPLKMLQDSLSKIDLTKNPSIWLGGDFNVPDVDWEVLSRKPSGACNYAEVVSSTLLDLIGDFSLTQLANEDNHAHQTKVHCVKNILQLLLVSNPDAFSPVKTLPGISDHFILSADVNLKPVIQRAPRRKVYKFAKADIDGLKSTFNAFTAVFLNEADTKTLDDNWTWFRSTVIKAMEEHIPSTMKSSRFNIPWMTRSLRKLSRRKKRAFYTAKSSNNIRCWKRYRSIRKQLQKQLRKAEREYLSTEVFESLKDDPKRFWSFIKNRRRDACGIAALWNGTQLVSSAQDKAEVLSNQYKSVFTREPTLPSSNPPKVPGKELPDVPSLVINSDGVLKILMKLSPHKAPGPDGIHPFILQKCAPAIAPVLAKIFNQSLIQGRIPKDWTRANVTAIFKKGSRTDPANYRPVSLTSICCKVMEHVIYSHVINHLDRHHALHNTQHGFRARRSCETQLLTTVHKIWESNEYTKQVDAVVLDFAKAFDTVPHERLLHKLHHYGIKGSLHKWISAFLKGRTQSVVVQGSYSKPAKVLSGVPQGTVLGPLLFLMYINDIPNGLKSNVSLFADDCVVYRPIKTASDCDLLQRDLKLLERWSSRWLMSFKPDKCSVIRFSRCKAKIEHTYRLCGQALQAAHQHKYLGVTLSSDMKWNTHVDIAVSKANSMVGFLRRNLGSAPPKVKIQAYKSLVRPHIEYCSSVWDPHTKVNIQKIEAVQRRAARFILNDYNRESSVTAMLETLQLPPLQQRRYINRQVMLHKMIYNNVDLAITDHLQFKKRDPSAAITRRSHPLSLDVPFSKTNCFQQSFFLKTAKEWNALPHTLLDIKDSMAFRQKLMSSQLD